MVDPCFPEPTSQDPTAARRGERTGDWLRRSTWVRAVECRRFYNRNLAALPPDASAALCKKLHRERSLAAHFELVVGRFLGVLGATELRYEVVGSEGRSVDWTARFPDGLVSVEATAPAVNSVVGEETKAAGPVLDILLKVALPGWHPVVVSVPRFAPTEPPRWVRRRLADELAKVPSSTPGAEHEIALEFEKGVLEITLLGASDPAKRPLDVSGPVVGYMDDTSEVVHRAVAGKRPQARGATRPVLAAVFTGGFGEHEVEKFDIALFGRTVVHQGRSEVTVDPSGVFSRGNGEPTFAGALAFTGLGWRGGPDPILYVHPRFNAPLPTAMLGLRRRSVTAHGIAGAPAQRQGLLKELGWPTS